MKSITLNLDKSVPYHLTTYSIENVDDQEKPLDGTS